MLRLDAIDLVEDQDFRLSNIGKIFKDRFRVSLDAALRVDHHHDDIGILGAAPCGGHHRLVQPAAGPENAGRIHEDDLRILMCRDAAHDRPCRLHLVRDDRDLGPDELIDQCGLACVRRADQRNEA